MRIFSIIAALVVTVLLYLFIVQRPVLTGADTAAMSGETAAPGTSAEAASELVKVVVQRSIAREVDTAVRLRGQTEASRSVEVRAETSARVASEPLRKGAQVAQGDVLCRLDEGTRGTALAQAEAQIEEARARVPEAEARLIQAQAQLEEARINQNASARLSQDGFASATRVANSEAAVATALAAVETARAGLRGAEAGIRSAEAARALAQTEIDRLTITAPFAGLLETDAAELGALLQPGALCATVLQLDPIKLVAFVPETEVGRIAVGAQARARLVASGSAAPEAPARDVSGTVTFLSRSADETTRTFRVEVAVPNDDLTLRDGQTAEIMIATDGAKAHLLPQSALTLNDQGTLGVRIVEAGDIVGFRPVRLMRDTPQGVWVTGLGPAADVIVLGQEYVIAGVQVAPSYRELSQ